MVTPFPSNGDPNRLWPPEAIHPRQLRSHRNDLGVKTVFLLGILFVIGCSGCMATGGNVAILTKANLVALGSVKSESQFSVFEVAIGRPGDTFDKRFDFSIRLSSGRVIKSDSFTRELVKSVATRINVLNSGEWGMGHVSYGVEGYSFVFQEERLVGFKAAEISLPNGTRLSATLGDASARTFFPLPLTTEQFQLLFGKPDSVERRKTL